MLDRIAEAERRASSAEQRAREAVDKVAEPLPEIDTSAIFDQPAADPPPIPEADPEPAPPVQPHGDPLLAPDPSPSRRPLASAQQPEWFSDSLEPDAVPARGTHPPTRGEPQYLPPAPGGPVHINTATYEQLRTLGLSVTQTGRVLAYRERVGGFATLDDLDQIPASPAPSRSAQDPDRDLARPAGCAIRCRRPRAA